MIRIWPYASVVSLHVISKARHYTSKVLIDMSHLASGDMRNLIKTLDEFHESYESKLDIVVNDKDECVALRNLILLALFGLEDRYEAAETIVHLWYSAKLTRKHAKTIETFLTPVVDAVCLELSAEDAESNQVVARSIPVGKGQFQARIRTSQWFQLQSMLSKQLDVQKGLGERSHIMLERTDHIHRILFNMRNGHRRVAKDNFRRCGILLPFGASSQDFVQLNP